MGPKRKGKSRSRRGPAEHIPPSAETEDGSRPSTSTQGTTRVQPSQTARQPTTPQPSETQPHLGSVSAGAIRTPAVPQDVAQTPRTAPPTVAQTPRTAPPTVAQTPRTAPPEVAQTSSTALAAVAQSETVVDTLSRAMRRLGLELTYSGSSRYRFAKRPGIGTLGRKINLIANYFPIDIPQGEIYHYDLEIDKIVSEKSESGDGSKKDTHKKYRCLNTKIKRNVVEAMIKAIDMFKNMRPAFDGEKNMYTRKRLPINDTKTFTVTVTDECDKSNIYEIKVKPANRKDPISRSAENAISLEPLHQLIAGRCCDVTEGVIMGIVAIETILRHGPALRLVPVGRSFFQQPTTEEIPPLSGGREIWFGHHQSMQLTRWKPMLNIDRSATAFYQSGPVINFMFYLLFPETENIEAALRQFRSLNDAQRRVLKKDLKTVRIRVTHLPYPRKYRIFDITKESASNTYFVREVNGRKVTSSVAEYFRSEYRALRYPNLPCLDVGSEKRNVYLPMEVCEIVEGQHCNKKLTDKQTSEMIRFTATPPAERFKNIQNSMRSMVQDLNAFSKEFGIRINPNPMHLTGRMLNPPQILYNQNQQIRPSNGSWDMRGKQFHTGVSIEKWMLLSFSMARFCNQNALENFIMMLRNGGRNVGINFSEPILMKSFTRRDGKPGDIIKQAKRIDPGLQLVIVVLPADGSQNIYSEIKSVAETELGLMTQCIKDVNVSGRKCNPQLICNLCQKINAKMGGVNNSLSQADKPPVLKRPVMIVGADCTHPSPGEKMGYSIAALVGSLDGYPSKYKASIRVQQPKLKEGIKCGQDVIVELKVMMKELLLAFSMNTGGKKPEKIIFYRDGASEGEFKTVMEYELKEIRKACEEMCRGDVYEPPITFIVVGKRHHTRFYPEDRRDGVGKPGNIPPGTTVDTDVVHPVFYDFFLCSHTGIQGTSRPAHYTVLWDDNNFSADELQSLTYYLCHTYVRCTRSVSIPCPVMYADLAAYRAKQYLAAKTEEMSSSGSEVSEREEVIVKDTIKQAIKVVDVIQNRMYFV